MSAKALYTVKCLELEHITALSAWPSCSVDIVRLRDMGRASTLFSRGHRNPGHHRLLSPLAADQALFDPWFCLSSDSAFSRPHSHRYRRAAKVPHTGECLAVSIAWVLYPHSCAFSFPFPGLPESTLLTWVFRFPTWQCLGHSTLQAPAACVPSLQCPSHPPLGISCVFRAGSKHLSSGVPPPQPPELAVV